MSNVIEEKRESLTMKNVPGDKVNERDLESGTTTIVASPDEQSQGMQRGSVESLPESTKEAAERGTTTKGESIVFVDGPIPDGGYGWIIVICQFFSQLATWGMFTVYGVLISWFTQNHTFGNTPPIMFAWIAGFGVSTAFWVSPLTSYMSKLFPLWVNLFISQVVLSLGFILAGFSTKIWQLALTQGVMTGFGVGLNFMATQPLISQWFLRRRALAMGLSSAGVGAGGLIFSFTTRLALQNHGVRIAYIINGAIIFLIQMPTTILLKPRMRVVNPQFKGPRLSLFKNLGLVYLSLWSFFVMFGYMIALLSVASYATIGLGLSQAQGASIQAALAAGQLIGRPGLGLILDAFGRVYMSSVVTFFAGFTCLVIWILAKSYGVMLLFAVLNGILSGIFFSALGPLISEVVPLADFSDALAIIWLVVAPITNFAAPMAFALNAYSKDVLHREGATIYQISIALAGGANVVAAIALMMVKKYQRKTQDV
ncbi:hypothetical protein FRC19_010368 [Serendipita sp. 401]|nr:hypothetical protein FRC19_010368 [Serendipita sp. 401]KAG9052462.1 hypothetical protein FS842_009832 [Serendipita sp. 407]